MLEKTYQIDFFASDLQHLLSYYYDDIPHYNYEAENERLIKWYLNYNEKCN